jgi:hypothetical protein
VKQNWTDVAERVQVRDKSIRDGIYADPLLIGRRPESVRKKRE